MSDNITKKVLIEVGLKNQDAQAAIESLKKDVDALKASIVAQKEAILAGKAAQQQYNTEVAKGKVDQQAVKLAIDQARLANIQATAANKKAKETQVAANGSYDEAQKKLTALGRAIKSVEGGFESTNPKIKAQIAEYNALNTKLKDFDKSLGNHQREVGHYENALKGLNGHLSSLGGNILNLVPGVSTFSSVLSNAAASFSAMSSGIEKIIKDHTALADAAAKAQEKAAVAAKADAIAQEQLAAGEITAAEATVINTTATKLQEEAQLATTAATEGTSLAMKLLKIAMASTGIGLLIVALGSLIAYVTETNEGSKKLKVVLAQLGAVFQQLMKLIAPIGKAIFDAFSDTAGVQFLTSCLLSLLIPLRTVIQVLTDIAHGNFKQAFIDIGEGVKESIINQVNGFKAGIQLTKDLTNNLVKAGDEIIKQSKNLGQVAKVAGDLARARQVLTKAEREWSEEKSKQQGEVTLLTKKLRDQNLTETERIKLAEKAKSIRESIYKTDLEHAKENERIIIAQQALNSKKDYQAITDAKNRTTEVTNSYNNEAQNIENRESRLQKSQEKAAQAAQEALEQAQAGILQADSERKASIARMLQANLDAFAKELSMADETYRQRLFKEEAFQHKMAEAAAKAKDPKSKALFTNAVSSSKDNEAQLKKEHAAEILKITEENNQKTYDAILKADLDLKNLQNESEQNELKQKLTAEDLKLQVRLDALQKEKDALVKSIAQNEESVKTASGDELIALKQTLDRQKTLLKDNNLAQEAETKASEEKKAKIKRDAAQEALMAQDEADVLKNKKRDGSTTSTEFEAEKKDITDKYNWEITEAARAGKSVVLLKQQELDALKALENNYREEKYDAAVKWEKLIQDTATTIIGNAIAHNYQATTVSLDKAKTAELKNTSLTTTQKQIIEEKYRVKAGQAAVKQFKANQKLQIANALINLMVAEGKLWYEPGFPEAIPLSIWLAAQGAAQIATIAAQKPPAYAQGVIDFHSDGRGARLRGRGTGTSDSMNARLSNGESVINAKSTSMFAPLLSAINEIGGGIAFSRQSAHGPYPGFATGGVYNTYLPTADNGLRPMINPGSGSNPMRIHSDDLNNMVGGIVSGISNAVQNMPPSIVDVKDINSQQQIKSANQSRVIL